MHEYQINIAHSAEDEGWIAVIPELPGCSAFGATPEEALAEVLTAREAWLEVTAQVASSHPTDS